MIICILFKTIETNNNWLMLEIIRKALQASVAAKTAILQNDDMLARVVEVSSVIARTFEEGRRVYFCGNGGSAADAQHLAAEFSGPFYNRQRRALPAEALHTNTSYLTAAANDYSYDVVYSRLVEGIMVKGDVLVGLSTSGNSSNVVLAFEAARNKGVITIGMTGASGGKMKDLSDYLFNIPSNDTPRIQECHMLIGHSICHMVEKQIFPAD